MEGDILKELSEEELVLLKDLYENHQQQAPHVYSFIGTCIAWKKKKPDSNYMTAFGAGNDWLQTGTFIALMQFNCYDLFMYTLEENCQTLREALLETEKIDWSRPMLWYSVSSRHVQTVLNFLKEKDLPTPVTVPTELYVVDRQEALQYQFECPEDLHLGKLDRSHAAIANSVWPHKSENTEKYLASLIEMNDSLGLFTKSDNNLACWVLVSPMGQMCTLQTVDEHKRKGYATIVTKAISKRIAEEGYHPLGTIVVGNDASVAMFERLGFRNIDTCTYVFKPIK